MLSALEDVRLADLKQEDAQRFINRISRDHAPKTVKNVHGLLSAALSTYCPEMVLRTTLPQKEKKEIQLPSMEEIYFLAEKSQRDAVQAAVPAGRVDGAAHLRDLRLDMGLC